MHVRNDGENASRTTPISLIPVRYHGMVILYQISEHH